MPFRGGPEPDTAFCEPEGRDAVGTAGLLQRQDTHHGLEMDWPSLSQGVVGSGSTLSPRGIFREGRTPQPRCGLRLGPRVPGDHHALLQPTAPIYGGVDLHARTLAVCIL